MKNNKEDFDKFTEKGRTGMIGMVVVLLFMILYGACGNAQSSHFGYEPDSRYVYTSVGFSSAKIPNRDDTQYILNTVVTTGVRYDWFGVSFNYEYANLEPKYHSWFLSAHVIPITVGRWELGLGHRYGRVIREDTEEHQQGGTYNYHGLFGDVKFTFLDRMFVELVGSYNYRGDIAYIWRKSYLDSFVWSTHLKVGIKF